MKKRKIKLLASLTSLVLVVAVMAVGVWAASTATVNITGSVTYSAQGNVKATIAGSHEVTGATNVLDPITSVTFDGTETTDDNTGTLAVGDITLTVAEGTSAETVITYTLTIEITNDWTSSTGGTNNYLKVVLTNPTTMTGITVGGDFASETTLTIAPEETKTLKFTISGTAGTGFSANLAGASLALSAVANA